MSVTSERDRQARDCHPRSDGSHTACCSAIPAWTARWAAAQASRRTRRCARVHRLKHVCRRRVWPAGVEGRLGRILQPKLDHFCHARPAQLRNKGQHKINACRNAPAGQDIAVPDDAALVDDSAEDRKQFPPCPVAGRTATAEEPSSAQNERPGTDRSQIAGGCSEPDNLFEKAVILDRIEAATAARHQEHVARSDGAQVLQIREGEAVRRDRLTIQRSHQDMQVGRAREKLVRTGEVELGNPVVHWHYYADWL